MKEGCNYLYISGVSPFASAAFMSAPAKRVSTRAALNTKGRTSIQQQRQDFDAVAFAAAASHVQRSNAAFNRSFEELRAV